MNNPNLMNNDDLEKDLEQKKLEQSEGKDPSNTNKSTAAEGELLDPSQDPHQVKPGEDGSIPDSEELSLKEEEDGYDDPDKLSS